MLSLNDIPPDVLETTAPLTPPVRERVSISKESAVKLPVIVVAPAANVPVVEIFSFEKVKFPLSDVILPSPMVILPLNFWLLILYRRM